NTEVPAGSGQVAAVGREGDAGDGSLVAAKAAEQLAGGGVPELYLARPIAAERVATGGGELAAFGVPGQAGDLVRVPGPGAEQLAGGGIPEADGAVVAARGQLIATWGVGHA